MTRKRLVHRFVLDGWGFKEPIPLNAGHTVTVIDSCQGGRCTVCTFIRRVIDRVTYITCVTFTIPTDQLID